MNYEDPDLTNRRPCSRCRRVLIEPFKSFCLDCEWLTACADYLKDGETPAECIERNRQDLLATLGLLAEAVSERDALRLRQDEWRRERDLNIQLSERLSQVVSGTNEVIGWQPMESYDKSRSPWVLLDWPYWSSHAVVGHWNHTIGDWWGDCKLEGASEPPRGWMPLPALGRD